jgi:hypothetical protein
MASVNVTGALDKVLGVPPVAINGSSFANIVVEKWRHITADPQLTHLYAPSAGFCIG